MVQLYNVDSPINREQRNNINATFRDILNRLSSLRLQISLLTGGADLEEIIQRIEDTITNANNATSNVDAKIQEVDTALADLATAIQNANTATTGANDATTAARQEITNMQLLVSRLGNAETYDNAKQYYLNNIVEFNGSSFIAIQDTLGNVPPALPLKRNDYWQLLAQRGVDGNGSVSSISGVGPDVNGNVELTPLDIGAVSTTELQQLQTQTNDLETKVYGVVEARQFGAIGDGVVDDTLAIQSMLDSNFTSVSFLNGVYRITSQLTTSLEGRTIFTRGATLLADTQDMTVLRVDGANSEISIDINGNNKAAQGIDVRVGGCRLHDCNIRDFNAIATGASAIRVETDLGVSIFNNDIKNISSQDNDVIGDNIGSARAILLTSTTPAIEMNIIKGNRINNILGEEGDAIQILFYDNVSNDKFLSALAIIENNSIKNANRRAIKVQASDVEVVSNKHTNTLQGTDLENASFVIDVINSDNVRVTNNTIDGTLIKAMQISGVEGNRCNNIFVKNNNIKASPTFALNGIYINQISNSDISNNNVFGGSPGIAIQGSQGVNIQSNSFYASDANRVAISIVASNDAIIVRDNIVFGERLYVVQNNAPNCIIENNHNVSGVGGCIRTFVTSEGSVYRNNTNNSTTQTVIGDFTDQYMSGSLNRGNGLSGIPNIIFTADIPSVTMPNRRHNRGDVAFRVTPSGGGSPGWVCITAGVGSASAWRTLPNIAT